MPTLQNLKDHYVSKHPASPLPDGLEEGLKAAAAKKAADEQKKAGKAPPGPRPRAAKTPRRTGRGAAAAGDADSPW